jgi:hypothetical protein
MSNPEKVKQDIPFGIVCCNLPPVTSDAGAEKDSWDNFEMARQLESRPHRLLSH